jgi:uncharacterized protein (TIGR02246 family)
MQSLSSEHERNAVSPDVSNITNAILKIENAINARWNNGDCTGFLEAYREDVTYFDPLTDRCLIGRHAVKEHFDKYFTGAPVVRSEQFNPTVVVNDVGDIAILTYNLQNYLAGKNGELQPIPLWSCTQVYRLADGKWNISAQPLVVCEAPGSDWQRVRLTELVMAFDECSPVASKTL